MTVVQQKKKIMGIIFVTIIKVYMKDVVFIINYTIHYKKTISSIPRTTVSSLFFSIYLLVDLGVRKSALFCYKFIIIMRILIT